MGNNGIATDIGWILTCTALVFVMQGGFLCLETGLVRSKNSIHVALKNLVDICIAGVIFWAVGYGLMFGGSYCGWVGTNGFFFAESVNPHLMAFFLFQLAFCGTAATIISGAISERTRFQGFVIITIFISAFIYPIFGHWAWGGAPNARQGWLAGLGFIDFAGSTVVHSTGGWISLSAVLVLGPRIGRYKDKNTKIPGHYLPLATLGTFLLCVGWIGFNGGSTLALNALVPKVVLNTVLSALSAGLVALIASWWIEKRPLSEDVTTGVVAGLVSITAGCHVMSPPVSMLTGGIGGLGALAAARCFERFHIDDVVNAVPMHAVAGVWGTIAVALLGDIELLGTGLSRFSQLCVQLLGAAVCFLWAFGLGYLFLLLIDRKFFPLRVSEEDEIMGLNISEHNATTPVLELINQMERQRVLKDLSLRIDVDPFTEAGMVGVQYNRVLDSLEIQDAALRKALEEAKDANAANIAKDTFLTNMSHELRTPLTGILGYARILMRNRNLTDSENKGLDVIYKSGEHLLALINDILDTAKIGAGKLELFPRPADLRDLLDSVAGIIQVAARRKDIEFVTDFSGDLPAIVQVDEKRLRQILLNLLGNAVKFTDRGSVALKVETRKIEDNRVRLGFEIRDTGVGMKPGELAGIFKPFEQAGDINKRPQGAGLGLAITRRLVRLMGAKIQVESEYSWGSVFRFEIDLPVPENAIQEHESECIFEESGPGQTESLPDDAGMIPPPRKELDALYELARFGSMDRIRRQADYLEELDDKYAPFACKLRMLADNFEDKRIVALIKQYMAE